MTQAFVYLYGVATQSEFEAEIDDPTFNLEMMASPQAAKVALDFKDWIIYHLIDEALAGEAEDGEPPLTHRDVVVELTSEGWSEELDVPVTQRWVYTFRHLNTEEVLGQVVVQKRRVSV